MNRLILASASPRRKELLTQLGLEIEVVVSNYNEQLIECLSPQEQAKKNALAKAESLHDLYPKDTIIAADTIVVLDGIILGKPVNRQDAKRMLKLLSGRIHQVITGFAVLNGQEKFVDTEQTEVLFRELTDIEIENYLNWGEYKDKAGAYGVQGIGSLLVERINGCYFNVVGLPLNRLYQIIKRFGYKII